MSCGERRSTLIMRRVIVSDWRHSNVADDAPWAAASAEVVGGINMTPVESTRALLYCRCGKRDVCCTNGLDVDVVIHLEFVVRAT